MPTFLKETKPRFLWEIADIKTESKQFVFAIDGDKDLEYFQSKINYDELEHAITATRPSSRIISMSLFNSASFSTTTYACKCSVKGKDLRGKDLSENLIFSSVTLAAGEYQTVFTSKLFSNFDSFQFTTDDPNIGQPAGIQMCAGFGSVASADLAAGTYFFLSDNSDEDFIKYLENTMNQEKNVSQDFSIYIKTPKIIPGLPDSKGIIRISLGTYFKLLVNSADNYTKTEYILSGQVLGFNITNDKTGSTFYDTEYPHQYGWYIQDYYREDSKDFPINRMNVQRALKGIQYGQKISTITRRNIALELLPPGKIFKDEHEPKNWNATYQDFYEHVTLDKYFHYARDANENNSDGKYRIFDAEFLNNWNLDLPVSNVERYTVTIPMIRVGNGNL